MLVTGGASFIGSHLVEALVAVGATVTVADDLSSGRREHLDGVRHDVHVLEGDLRERDFAARACAGAEMVFHLAAAHGGRGYIDTHPVECLNNIVLDHNVLDAATRAGAEKIVFASSACAYPTVLQDDAERRQLLRETDAGFDVPGKAFADGEYGWSKLVTELQLDAFHREHGIDAVACRIFTAYGERENESHAVIALIAKALARLDPFPVWGDGRQTRNFTYVGDTVSGVLLAGANLSGFEVINVGTPNHTMIDELIDEIFSIVGWCPGAVDRQLDMPVGVRSRAADVEKCRSVLSWEPSIDLHSGLERTIAWYEKAASAERLAELDQLLLSRS